MNIPVEEYNGWVQYYTIKSEEQQKELNKAKMQGKRR
jgi:hypothetical protein|tara:strand:- start:5 stop:115 length:111 start_codon:yes stop_codon:yes gene_type:complete